MQLTMKSMEQNEAGILKARAFPRGTQQMCLRNKNTALGSKGFCFWSQLHQESHPRVPSLSSQGFHLFSGGKDFPECLGTINPSAEGKDTRRNEENHCENDAATEDKMQMFHFFQDLLWLPSH